MSWNFGIPPTSASEFDAAADAALEQAQANIALSNPEGKDQAEAAVAAVKSIVAAGVVGSGLVSASLTGHGNPDHAPRSGYSHDSLYITVSCAEPYPPAGTGG